jgi:protein gp37
MQPTNISWCDFVNNVVTGCDRMSPGCDNCYALHQAARMQRMHSQRYQVDGNPRTSGPGFGLTLHHDKIRAPLAVRRPKRVFMCSMGDLFHHEVPLAFLQEVFAIMIQAHWHTFIILTKRAKRLRALAPQLPWPPNVWMGVSVEMPRYLSRIRDLCQTPAAVKLVSFEPLLEPMGDLDLTGISWAIVGGESDSKPRPMPHSWVWPIRDACAAVGAAFFFKQSSAWKDAKGESLRHEDGTFWLHRSWPDERYAPVPGVPHALHGETPAQLRDVDFLTVNQA